MSWPRYDNGPNIKGRYEGAQAVIFKHNHLTTYSPCACHRVNLCEVNAAESCPTVVTFYWFRSKTLNAFSASPHRWDILEKKQIGCSIHSMSKTRWWARLAYIKPVAAYVHGLRSAVDDVLELNLTTEARPTLNGVKSLSVVFSWYLCGSKYWLQSISGTRFYN